MIYQQLPGYVDDIECILDSSNTFIPILICYTKEDSDKIFDPWGTHCSIIHQNHVAMGERKQKRKQAISLHHLLPEFKRV